MAGVGQDYAVSPLVSGDMYPQEYQLDPHRPMTAAAPELSFTPEMNAVRQMSRHILRPQTDPGLGMAGISGLNAQKTARSVKMKQFKLLQNFIPPSSRYPEVEGPSRSLLRRCAQPPNPVLPRRPVSRHMQASRGAGSRRGEVDGKNGGKYKGEVLAGRPHGQGQYWIPSGTTMRLQYEGEWVQGMREGYGSIYYWTGEAYHGELVQNQRHGHGRMEYKGGDVYEGQFCKDRKHGMGTHYYANGDCFVGFFATDKREGLGSMYWLSRAKKYEGEWRGDRPCTGQIKAMSEEEEDHLARERLTTVAISKPLPEPLTHLPLPKLELKAPSQVVFGQAVDVRRVRQSGREKDKAAMKLMGTLDNSTMERLKHAFVALAGGDAPRDFVRPSKISDVLVLAGLDPASPEVPVLLRALHEHSRRDAKLTFDDFLNVLFHFRCLLE